MTPYAVKLTVVGFYFLALIVIAFFASRRIGDISDYFVGGKKLNYWVVAFSSRATGESGWLLLGVTGLGFTVGAHAFWVLLGEMLGVCLCWVLIPQRFKTLTDRYGSITVPDYLESRFRDSAHHIRLLSAGIIFVFVTAYLSAQLTAAGKAFQIFLDMPYHWGAMLGLGIVLAYTVAGGFVAVAWSDFLQGLLMVLGLVVLPAAAFVHAGGPGAVLDSLRSMDPALLRPMGSCGLGLKGWLSAAGLTAVGIGYLGSPQILVRFMALRNVREIRQGSLVAASFTVLATGGAILTGIAGRAVFGTLGDPEAVLPELVGILFHPVVVGFFIAVVLAAIMSTADSLLILASSAVVRDFYQKVFRPRASDVSLTGMSRITTAVLCAAALLFALIEARVVFWFVLFAWAGIAAAFCPVIVLSLFWKGLTRQGVMAGMIAGFLTVFVWKSVPVEWLSAALPGFSFCLGSLGFGDAGVLSDVLYEILPGCAAAAAAAVAVSRVTRRPEHAGRDLDELRGQVVDVWR